MKARWTKITQDNMEYVYYLDANGPLMFAWVDNDNVTHYGTLQSFGLTISTMAKSNDSYYYYEIPCLHKNLKLLNK
jgi:hypothetical protein